MIKRKAITIEEKLQIIEELKNGETMKTLAAKYECDIATIRRIIAKESEICHLTETVDLNRKRLRLGHHSELEETLCKWFKEEEKKGTPITTKILLARAQEFCNELGINFKPHITWLQRWKLRHGIEYGKNTDGQEDLTVKFEDLVNLILNDKENIEVYLEKNDCDDMQEEDSPVQVNVPTEQEAHLEEDDNISGTELMEQYTTDNIFNAAASGLLYKALPDSKYSLCTQQQDRLTLLFICNATASYKKIFVIGKAVVAFDDMPLPYYVNKNACMATDLWIKILTSLDIEFGEMNRKVLMYVDMLISDNNLNIKLKNIKLQLLTGIPQPLDQGIIGAFKREYRQIIVRKQLIALELGKHSKVFSKSISILKALGFIKQAWSMIKEETIFKGFELAGCIQSKIPTALYDGIPNWQEFLHCDDYVPCYGENIEVTILNDFVVEKNNCNVSTNKEELKKVFKALQVLDQYSVEHGLGKIQENLHILEEELLKFAKTTISQNQTP